MKSIYLIIIILLAFFCFSCAPKPIVIIEEPVKPIEDEKLVEPVKPAEPVKPIEIIKPFEPLKPEKPLVHEELDFDDNLFSRAEKEFIDQSYDKSLELYNEYLSIFPDKPFAAPALMKIGAIYTVFENYAESRKSYMRLIDEYPDNFFVPDAIVEILLTFYNERKYKEVIRQASGVFDKVVSKIHLFRTYAILGDANMALGFPIDATYSYAIALEESEGPGREAIIEKLKEAFRQITIPKIIFLLKYLDDELLQAYLMFQLGIDKAENKEYAGAVNSLSKFIEKFPVHENTQQAKTLVEELNKKFMFSPNTIGCLLPLSGRYKTYGKRALKGIELALNQFGFKDINPTIKIIIKDTKSDLNMAVLAVRELFQEQVAAILGPILTAVPAAFEAQNIGIPIITLTQKENITDVGEYVFRNFLTPKMQVRTLVSYAIEELMLKNFAILYPNENYGITFMNLFWDELIVYGGKVVGVESYKPVDTDFAGPIKKLVGLYYEIPEDLKDKSTMADDEEYYYDQKIRENYENVEEEDNIDQEPEAIIDFDALFIPESPKKAGLIIPQLAFYDIENVYLLGTNIWHSNRLIKMTQEYIQDAIITDGFFAGSTSKNVKKFVKLFKKTYKEKPGLIEAIAYDTAMILFQTVVSIPDVRYRNIFKDALLNLNDFQGITGHTSFDNKGNVYKKIYILQIKGNKFVEVELED